MSVFKSTYDVKIVHPDDSSSVAELIQNLLEDEGNNRNGIVKVSELI